MDKGLISREQAGQIRALYPEPKTALPWGTIIFSGIGAGIAGLGVILLLAYNWHAIPKAAKLAIIFLGLAGLHAGGIRLFLQGERWRQLGEALCVLGSMFFGAGIWLVAPIYHIDEHFPNEKRGSAQAPSVSAKRWRLRFACSTPARMTWPSWICPGDIHWPWCRTPNGETLPGGGRTKAKRDLRLDPAT